MMGARCDHRTTMGRALVGGEGPDGAVESVTCATCDAHRYRYNDGWYSDWTPGLHHPAIPARVADYVRRLRNYEEYKRIDQEEIVNWLVDLAARLEIALHNEAFTEAELEKETHALQDAEEKLASMCSALVALTCGPADEPTTESEKAHVALDEAIERFIPNDGKRQLAPFQAALWQALANELKPLHELVKKAGECACPDAADTQEGP